MEFQSTNKLICMRNSVMYSFASDMTSGRLDYLPSSQDITAEIQQAVPAKKAPTSPGTASLTPAPAAELKVEELQKFLADHHLKFCAEMDGIKCRAHKV